MFGENRRAAVEMMDNYDTDLMGKLPWHYLNTTERIKMYTNLTKMQKVCTRLFSTNTMPNSI